MERTDSLLELAVADNIACDGAVSEKKTPDAKENTNPVAVMGPTCPNPIQAKQQQSKEVVDGAERKLFPKQGSRFNLRQSLEGAALFIDGLHMRDSSKKKDPSTSDDGRRHVQWNNKIEVYWFPLDYTPEEIRKTWWRNPEDFDDMRKVTQFIGRASLDETVRRWMESQYRQQQNIDSNTEKDPNGTDGSHCINEANEYVCDSDEEDDLCYSCCSLFPCAGKNDPLDPRPNRPREKIRNASVVRVADDKWWHKYGHSRRGVENIGTAEGAQRLHRINEIRRQVVAEYRRQILLGEYDPIKLSLHYKRRSLWARDLAIAAGASDADAVEKDFDDTARHSREYYLIKKQIAKGIAPDEAENMPTFMVPQGLVLKSAMRPTMGGPGRPQQQPQPPKQQQQVPVSKPPMPRKKEAGKTMEMLKDAPDRRSNLAKQASGLGAGGASMGAVLSGMGNSEKEGNETCS